MSQNVAPEKDQIIHSAVPVADAIDASDAQPHSQDKIDKKLREIKDLKDRDQPDKPKENPLKPDDSKQAIMMLALCALCIIGAIATGGVIAQVLGVFAAATGLFGLKKAKDAIFPPGAPIEKKFNSANEKAIDAKVKQLENIVEFQKGYERGKDGGDMDPDSIEREARKGKYFTTAIPKLSTQEIAGFNQGQLERQQREEQSKKDQSSQQNTSSEDRLSTVESQLKEISLKINGVGVDSTPVAHFLRQQIKTSDQQGPGDQFGDRGGENPNDRSQLHQSLRQGERGRAPTGWGGGGGLSLRGRAAVQRQDGSGPRGQRPVGRF